MIGIIIVTLALLVSLTLALSGQLKRHPACLAGTTEECSWCHRWIGGVDPAIAEKISHGICAECFTAEMAKAKKETAK